MFCGTAWPPRSGNLRSLPLLLRLFHGLEPTALVVASTDATLGGNPPGGLSRAPTFRLYANSDPNRCRNWCSVKNVVRHWRRRGGMALGLGHTRHGGSHHTRPWRKITSGWLSDQSGRGAAASAAGQGGGLGDLVLTLALADAPTAWWGVELAMVGSWKRLSAP